MHIFCTRCRNRIELFRTAIEEIVRRGNGPTCRLESGLTGARASVNSDQKSEKSTWAKRMRRKHIERLKQ